jgi:putative transposase
VVGWELGRTLAARLPIAALEKAIAERKPPPGVVHHSDRGVQYASDVYVAVLQKHGMIPSMSRPANPYDNASCESFMKTLKREEIYANQYRDLDHLRSNIAEFIDSYYNRVRLHSALGYKPPEEFEQAANASTISQGATMSFFRHEEIYRSDVGSKTEGEPAEPGSPNHRLDESPAGYSSAGCSPVLGCCSRQGRQGTEGDNMGRRRPAGSRPSYALVLKRARFSSVVPGCVVKTVVTEACFDRPPILFRRLPDFPRSGRAALGRIC